VIEEYKPLAIIGKGSTGMVIRAQCRATKKNVAVKQICKIYDSYYMLKKALREVSILKYLS